MLHLACEFEPVDLPPCSRQRPFGIAGDRHGFPFLVRAPHRGLWCIGNGFFTGLISSFRRTPRHPLAMAFDMADDGLAALVDVDVLDGDLLLTSGPVAGSAPFGGRQRISGTLGCDSNVCFPRLTFSMMELAEAVQTKSVGSALCWSR